MRKSKDIRLFGIDLKLYERDAIDVLEWVEMQDNIPEGLSGNLMNWLICIEDSLKYNRIKKSWKVWKWKNARRYNEKLSAKYLRANLTVRELADIFEAQLLLDGYELDKKKVQENPSAVKLSEQ